MSLRTRLFLWFILPLSITKAESAGPAPWSADQGDGTYKNPVLFSDYSDPDGFRVGEEYYLISSSFNCAPAYLSCIRKISLTGNLSGTFFPKLVPETVFSTPQHGKGVWAPALRYRAGTYYVYYTDPDFGIYVATAKNPAGPWSVPVLVKEGKGLIDPCPLWDTDGKAYLVHGWAKSRTGINNRLSLMELSPDWDDSDSRGQNYYRWKPASPLHHTRRSQIL